MEKNKNKQKLLSDLPVEIPIILNSKLFLLPQNELPLDVYDIKYLDTIDYSFRYFNRYIAICDNAVIENCRDQIATLARITKFEEVSEDKYTISVCGIIRFNILDIYEVNNNVTVVKPDYLPFSDDLVIQQIKIRDRESINDITNKYLSIVEQTDLSEIDIQKVPDHKLVSFLSNYISLSQRERKQLINAKDINEASSLISNLLEYEVAVVESQGEAKH